MRKRTVLTVEAIGEDLSEFTRFVQLRGPIRKDRQRRSIAPTSASYKECRCGAVANYFCEECGEIAPEPSGTHLASDGKMRTDAEQNRGNMTHRWICRRCGHDNRATVMPNVLL